jgi:2'-5' RNA ligase
MVGPGASPRRRPAGPPTRRLFFALWPDEFTRAALTRATRKVVRRSGGRPVPPTNYHLTLAFLGNQPAELFDRIVAAAALVRAAPFELTLERYGHWPKPRVFWIGPSPVSSEQASTALSAPVILASQLWDRLEVLGLYREPRPFRAHVTLARKVAALPEVPPPDPLIWKASGFALVESVTEPSGAVYAVVAEFPLTG